MALLNLADRWKDNLRMGVITGLMPVAGGLGRYRVAMVEEIGRMSQSIDQIREHMVIPPELDVLAEERELLTAFLAGVVEAGAVRREEVLAEREAARVVAEREAKEEADEEAARRQRAEDERWRAYESEQADYSAWKKQHQKAAAR